MTRHVECITSRMKLKQTKFRLVKCANNLHCTDIEDIEMCYTRHFLLYMGPDCEIPTSNINEKKCHRQVLCLTNHVGITTALCQTSAKDHDVVNQASMRQSSSPHVVLQCLNEEKVATLSNPPYYPN
jgi:hypothetical protein